MSRSYRWIVGISGLLGLLLLALAFDWLPGLPHTHEKRVVGA